MTDRLKAYATSKGVNTSNSGWLAVKDILLEEYGYVAPVFKACSTASIVTLAIDSLLLHEKYLEKVHAAPLTPMPEDFIAGLVVRHGESYRLIDGYHRVKYCITTGRKEAAFILAE